MLINVFCCVVFEMLCFVEVVCQQVVVQDFKGVVYILDKVFNGILNDLVVMVMLFSVELVQGNVVQVEQCVWQVIEVKLKLLLGYNLFVEVVMCCGQNVVVFDVLCKVYELDKFFMMLMWLMWVQVMQGNFKLVVDLVEVWFRKNLGDVIVCFVFVELLVCVQDFVGVC